MINRRTFIKGLIAAPAAVALGAKAVADTVPSDEPTYFLSSEFLTPVWSRQLTAVYQARVFVTTKPYRLGDYVAIRHDPERNHWFIRPLALSKRLKDNERRGVALHDSHRGSPAFLIENRNGSVWHLA